MVMEILLGSKSTAAMTVICTLLDCRYHEQLISLCLYFPGTTPEARQSSGRL